MEFTESCVQGFLLIGMGEATPRGSAKALDPGLISGTKWLKPGPLESTRRNGN